MHRFHAKRDRREYLYTDDRSEVIFCDPERRTAHSNVKVKLDDYLEAQTFLANETLRNLA